MSRAGRLHSIQTMGTLDGPGVRFVAFLQGCPLRCGYCHNPDTWDAAAGEEITAQALFDRAVRYRGYFGREGGVTLSGGEPLLQAEFAGEFFSLCRRAGIHTALDTSGFRLDAAAKAALCQTDLVLLDIKMTTEEDYRRHTGCGLGQVLDFLRYCGEQQIPLWIRHVVVPGLNDTDEDAKRLAELLSGCSTVQKVEFLPFRKLCLEKYRQLGVPFPLESAPEGTADACRMLQKRAGLLN
ncbi:MAG: pyruvate formate-lyase-activating protein [Oscillospiraceae bacterium]|nr:pyruvate formate-lyase-activating protein [Oscillospiraceae bacterium]